jgi:hypothetical protein
MNFLSGGEWWCHRHLSIIRIVDGAVNEPFFSSFEYLVTFVAKMSTTQVVILCKSSFESISASE